MGILTDLKEVQFSLDQCTHTQARFSDEYLRRAKEKLQQIIFSGEQWEEAQLYRGEGYDSAHRDGSPY